MIAKAEFKDNGVFEALREWRRKASNEVQDAVSQAVKRFHRDFARKRLTKTAASVFDDGGVNSAHLRRALKNETRRKTWDHIVGRVYFRGHWEPVARIHEEGGIIRPRRKKFLTVPTEYAKKHFMKSTGRVMRAPRIPDTYITRTKKGALGIFLAPKRFGRAIMGRSHLLFLLLKQVKIRARLHFKSDWNDYEPHAWKILEKARDRAVAKGRAMFA